MTAPDSVLVVGASAAGLSTAESLRRSGYAGRITLLGAEKHAPYDRPPLSKQALAGTWDPDRTRLRTADQITELDAEFVLGDPAEALDSDTRTVHTASGRAHRAEAVVLATGLRPRTLPGQHELSGVHVMRTLDDCTGLRSDLLRATRLVVVGEGVLGVEMAATARGMGLDVTVVGPRPAPMAGQIGTLVGTRLAELHTERGVALRLGTGVGGFTATDGRVDGVQLDTGEIVPADAVAVAVGAVPETGWLAGSGLEVDDGIVCDARCRAAPGIYAVGDVARWWHEQLDAPVRLENRTNATAQAQVVAANVLGGERAYAPVPYFWTDQYDVKIQVHGFLPADAEVTVVDGDLAAGRFVARYARDGRATGVLGWNMAKQTRLRRQEVVDALAGAAGT
ncbi:FAD-dependent oxidoreductase [Saccharopolyspora sp. HNM0983]|uniref:FAD-dependent oxidoreductase n=1 Tax=Saccharopolyspora montiporae TaxID=2781240 RepID=A0A929B5U3_9PSEU|nr:FAD-dependent oxidoreductase [Saccharopolyspora sp. HNM0983]